MAKTGQRRRRRHTNTTGYRQIQRGRTRAQVAHMARTLGVPYATTYVPPPATVGLPDTGPRKWGDGGEE
jgi:hypothetical protein